MQANTHVRYLSSYMSDSFNARGGDNEAVLVILLIPRMMWKANILISQIKESFNAPENIDKDTLLKGQSQSDIAFLQIITLNSLPSNFRSEKDRKRSLTFSMA